MAKRLRLRIGINVSRIRPTPARNVLLVALEPAANFDLALESLIKKTLQTELSPRHIPDEIVYVSAVPRSINGKKIEVAVKRILLGEDSLKVVIPDAMANPESLGPIIE